jgi:hypothetical protein
LYCYNIEIRQLWERRKLMALLSFWFCYYKNNQCLKTGEISKRYREGKEEIMKIIYCWLPSYKIHWKTRLIILNVSYMLSQTFYPYESIQSVYIFAWKKVKLTFILHNLLFQFITHLSHFLWKYLQVYLFSITEYSPIY